MTISVVISSYRGNEQLAKACIESLNSQVEPPLEIIVVVDTREEQYLFSTYLSDSTEIPLNIVYSGKKGLAAARNKGIEESKGDIIAFIDDDAVADRQWLSEINKTFEISEAAGVVGGPVYPLFEEKSTDEKFYWIIGCTSTNPPSSRPIGCNMAFRRDVFKKAGTFDEGLGRVRKKLAVGEETELFLRIEKKLPKYSIIFNDRAIMFHTVPARRLTFHYFIKRAYEEGFSKARIRKDYKLQEEQKFFRYYLRHLDLPTLIVLTATGVGYLNGLIHHLW
jgi:glycosyltransferase involved in cell wall biosynthesis